MEQVKLLSMTAVLTVLIWASADSLVNETVLVSVYFDVTPAIGTSDMLVAPVRPRELYEVQISGPRRIVEDVQAQPSPLPVRLRVPVRATGATTITLDRAMLKEELSEQWNEFRKLTIVSVMPDTLPVLVDHWVTKEVQIALKGLTLAYDVEPQLGSSAVAVRMRESLFNEQPQGQPLQIDISADVERLLKDQTAGERVNALVNLDNRPFGPGAELSPPAIEVVATVKAQRMTEQIATVPILFAVSAANLEKTYRVVANDGSPLSLVTQTITVTGPTDEVARLLRGATRAFGIIQLKENDLQQLGSPRLVTPEFHLPPGIELATQPPPIEFRLIDVSGIKEDQ